MKKYLLGFAGLAFLFVAGCSSLATNTPAQAVYSAKGAFLVAIKVADAYKNLPACGGTAIICSDKDVVVVIRKAANAADAALDSAEATVRDPKFGNDQVQSAVLAAQNAVVAFTSITDQLKIK